MSVKIVTERVVDPERQEEAFELLRELRARAVLQPGYVFGETLVSVDRPGKHMVISTWNKLRDWEAWENNPERLQMLHGIESLLVEPIRTSVYTAAWATPPEGL